MKRGVVLIYCIFVFMLINSILGISVDDENKVESSNVLEPIYKTIKNTFINHLYEKCSGEGCHYVIYGISECKIKCSDCQYESELGSSSLFEGLKNLFNNLINYLKEKFGFKSKVSLDLENPQDNLQDNNPNDGVLDLDQALKINKESSFIRKCTEKCPDKTQIYYENCVEPLEEFLESCPADSLSETEEDMLSSFAGLGGKDEEEIKQLLEDGKYAESLIKVNEVIENLNPHSDKHQYFNNMKYEIYLMNYLENDITERDFAKSILNIEDFPYVYSNSEFSSSLEEFEKKKLALKSLAYQESGDYDSAYKLYEKLEELAWEGEPDLEIMANVLIGQAEILKRKGDYAGALDKIEKAYGYLQNSAIKEYQNQLKQEILYLTKGYNGESIRDLLEDKKERLGEENDLWSQLAFLERKYTSQRFVFSKEEIEKRTQQKFEQKGRILNGIKVMNDLIDKGYDLDLFINDILNKGNDDYADEVIYNVALPDVWNREDIKDRHYQPYKDFVLEAIASKPGDIALMIANGNRDYAIRLIKEINLEIELNVRDYPTFIARGEEGKYLMGVTTGQGYAEPILSTNEEVADFGLAMIDPLVIAGVGTKVVRFGKGALSLSKMRQAYKMGVGLKISREIESGKFSAGEIARINKGINVLKEAGFTEKAELFSKSPEFQKALLKAHYTANNIDAGQICAKSRILRRYFIIEEQRILFKNWVVGDNLAQEILDSERVVTKPHELNKIAEKMGYTLKNVKEGKAVIDSSGKIITRIPQHSKGLKKFTARGILEDLARAGPNL